MRAVDGDTIEILKKVDSPTVCNVIELFRVRSQAEGFLHHSIRALFPELPPMVGHAVTCTFTSAAAPPDGVTYGGLGRQVEALLAVPAPRVFVIQDLDDDSVGAAFGEVMASTYMAFGCVGIVTSGGARDTPAIRKRKLPLFARSYNVSHAYPQYLALNVPVQIGGVTIRPGDLLHGDADGVTTVPVDLAPRIAAMCDHYLQIEKRFIDYVDSGRATAAGVADLHAANRKLITEAVERIARTADS